MRLFWLAILAFGLVLTLHGQESGISPHPPDPTHPGQHDVVVRVAWSEAESSGTLEIDHQKFSKLEDVVAVVQTRLAGDPDLRVVFWPVGHVPIEFAKQVATAFRQGGIARLAAAMPEGPVILPVAKGAKATPSPGPQLVIRVVSPTAESDSHIEIEDHKFLKAEETLDLLQARAKANPDMRILIRADRNVHYDYLKQILVMAGKAGLDKVTFSVVDEGAGKP